MHDPDDRRRRERLKWLQWSVERSRLWVIDDRELLDRFEAVFGDLDRRDLLRELERRLATWPVGRHRELVRILARMERTHRASGRRSQRVDGLLQRFLRQVDPTAARSLARVCATSPRYMRRRAAWSFYALRGLDAAAREALACRADREDTWPFWEMVMRDARLVMSIGPARVIAAVEEAGIGSDSVHWHALVLQAFITEDCADDLEPFATVYPVPAIIAIRRSRDAALAPLVARLVTEFPDDPAVVSSGLHALGMLGAHDLLRETLPVGMDLLLRQRLGLTP